MKRLALIALAACSGGGKSTPTPRPAVLPPASTICYAGLTTGGGAQTRTIERRAVDPAAGTITEDIAHDAESAHGATSFHVVETVTPDAAYTLAEGSGAFTGSGQLRGEPWKWSEWSQTTHLARAPIEIVSESELTDTGLQAKKRIRQGDKVLAEIADDLKPFDCAQWDAVKATLTVPPLDDDTCKAACIHFATLKYWAHHDPADAAGSADLAQKLAAGTPKCVMECRTANDALATHCLLDAQSVDALDACQK